LDTKIKAAPFRRGLPAGALEYLKSAGWWSDVLSYRYLADGADRPLIIAVRDGYLNVYAEGQSILEIRFLRTVDGEVRPRCRLHWKYVLPDVEGDVYLDFDGSEVSGRAHEMLPQTYEGRDTLQRWVTAAREFRGKEKIGVARIVERNPNVIDLEMALPTDKAASANGASRMDIVALEKDGDGVRIAFYEAKRFSNPELRNCEPSKSKVLGQLVKYRDYVSQEVRRKQVEEAYANACVVLTAIDTMRGHATDPLIEQVARAAKLGVWPTLDPKPRLVVFDYKDHQVGPGSSWERHERAIRENWTLIQYPSAAGVVLNAS
jgi:hypothetical protein